MNKEVFPSARPS